MPKGTEENKEIEERFKSLEFHKSFSLSQIEKAEGDDPYYFEGIASTYKNADAYNDIFLEGSLDDMIGKKIPVMPNHSWDILKAIGHGTLEKDGNKIIVKGYFVKDDPDAEKIVKLKKAGVPISLSIGGSIIESTITKRSGQLYREISKGTIREVSTVLAGANPKAKITKSEEGEMKMAGTAEKNENVVQVSREEYQKMLDEIKKTEALQRSLQEISGKLENFNKSMEEKGKTAEKPSDEEEKDFTKMYEELKKSYEEKESEFEKAIAKIEKFEKEGMDSMDLVSSCATASTQFLTCIPWCDTAIFLAALSGVSTLDALPYNVFSWGCAAAAIGLSIFGIGFKNGKRFVDLTPVKAKVTE